MPRTARRQKNARRAAFRPMVDVVPPMPFTPFSIAWMVVEADLWARGHVVHALDQRFPYEPYEAEFAHESPACRCCCHEHTFGRACPAYAVGTCRGQGTVEERELHDWYRTTRDDLHEPYDDCNHYYDSDDDFRTDDDDADREDHVFAAMEAAWHKQEDEERRRRAVFERPYRAPRQLARAGRRRGGPTRATAQRRMDRLLIDEALEQRMSES